MGDAGQQPKQEHHSDQAGELGRWPDALHCKSLQDIYLKLKQLVTIYRALKVCLR
jgi:hypothetical protein